MSRPRRGVLTARSTMLAKCRYGGCAFHPPDDLDGRPGRARRDLAWRPSPRRGPIASAPPQTSPSASSCRGARRPGRSCASRATGCAHQRAAARSRCDRPAGTERACAAPRGRTARVRVELSADHGRARLSVGRRTTSVTGRYVAEDAVAVGSASSAPCESRPRPRRAARLAAPRRRRRLRAPPRQLPLPRMAPSPAPTAASALFAPTSVWNAAAGR